MEGTPRTILNPRGAFLSSPPELATWRDLSRGVFRQDDGLTGVRVQALRRFAAEPASGKEGFLGSSRKRRGRGAGRWAVFEVRF